MCGGSSRWRTRRRTPGVPSVSRPRCTPRSCSESKSSTGHDRHATRFLQVEAYQIICRRHDTRSAKRIRSDQCLDLGRIQVWADRSVGCVIWVDLPSFDRDVLEGSDERRHVCHQIHTIGATKVTGDGVREERAAVTQAVDAGDIDRSRSANSAFNK